MLLWFMSGFASADQTSAVDNPVVIGLQDDRKTSSLKPMLYTGNSRGGSHAWFLYPSIEELKKVWATESVHSRMDSSTLYTDDWMLLGQQNLESLLYYIEHASAFECSDSRPVTGWKNHLEWGVLLQGEWASMPFDDSSHSPMALHAYVCKTSKHRVEMVTPTTDAPNDVNWIDRTFEYVPTVHLQKGTLSLSTASLPVQDMSRVVRRIQESNGVYWDSGNFVSGLSTVKENHLSLHRNRDFHLLESLNPIVLGIGSSELVGGISNFQSEIVNRSLPYINSNLKQGEEYVFEPYVIKNIAVSDADNIDVLFMSVVDPSIQNTVLSGERVEILDPVKAIWTVIENVEKSGEHYDLTVVLTTAGSTVLRDIRERGPSLDLLIGDASLATFKVKERTFIMNHEQTYYNAAPVTFPTDGLQQVQLKIENGQLSEVYHETIEILESDPIFPELTKAVFDVRTPLYISQNTPLITMGTRQWSNTISRKEWEQSVCHIVQQQSHGDTILLPQVSTPKHYGDMTIKQVGDTLKGRDALKIYWLPGSQYSTFLQKSVGLNMVSCGISPTLGTPKPRGVSVDKHLLYSIVTTESAVQQYNLEPMLKGSVSRESKQHLDGSNLREYVLSALHSYKDSAGELTTISNLLQTPQVMPTHQVLFKINDVSFTTENFSSPQQIALSQVPESMINNPSSSTIGGSVDVSLEYIRPNLNGVLRSQNTYSSLTLTSVDGSSEDASQEASDDMRQMLTVTYTKSNWNTGPLAWKPFGEILYDSEWTPLELEDGSLASRQSDLSFTGGISANPYKGFKTLKIGMMVNRDMAQLREKPSEYAGSMQLNTNSKILNTFIWTNEGTALFYGKTPEDDASDLRWRTYLKTKLTLPVTRTIGVSLHGTGLGVQGRSEENNVVGFGWNTAVSIDLLGSFQVK